MHKKSQLRYIMRGLRVKGPAIAQALSRVLKGAKRNQVAGKLADFFGRAGMAGLAWQFVPALEQAVAGRHSKIPEGTSSTRVVLSALAALLGPAKLMKNPFLSTAAFSLGPGIRGAGYRFFPDTGVSGLAQVAKNISDATAILTNNTPAEGAKEFLTNLIGITQNPKATAEQREWATNIVDQVERASGYFGKDPTGASKGLATTVAGRVGQQALGSDPARQTSEILATALIGAARTTALSGLGAAGGNLIGKALYRPRKDNTDTDVRLSNMTRKELDDYYAKKDKTDRKRQLAGTLGAIAGGLGMYGVSNMMPLTYDLKLTKRLTDAIARTQDKPSAIV